MMDQILLRTEAIRYIHQGRVVLSDIWFQVRAGEIAGIAGLANSGKTMFSRILSGEIPADSGRIFYQDILQEPYSAGQFLRDKTVYVSGENWFIKELSILDHLIILKERHAMKVLRRSGPLKEAGRILKLAKIDADPMEPMSALSYAERIRLLIVKEIYFGKQIIIMDHVLESEIMERDMEIIRNVIQSYGAAIVQVSNHVELVMRYCDTLMIMCRGKTAQILPKSRFQKPLVYSCLLGGTQLSLEDEKAGLSNKPETPGDPEKKRVIRRMVFRWASLLVREQEILGVVSLDNEWNRDFMDELVERYFDEKNSFFYHISGWDSLIPDLSLTENLLLPSLKRLSGPGGILDLDILKYYEKKSEVKGTVKSLNVQEIMRLNLEKIRISRPAFCAMLNPTEGLDTTLEKEFHQRCRKLSAEGIGFLFVGTSFSAFAKMCDRLILLKNGEITKSVSRKERMLYDDLVDYL